jgi:anti-anti-sigma factor
MSVLDAGLQVSGFRVDGVVVVVVQGALDTHAAPSLRAAFDALDADDHVYVDCADVEFIDAEGFSVLCEAARRNVMAGGPLHVHTSSALQRMVEISGAAHLFALD